MRDSTGMRVAAAVVIAGSLAFLYLALNPRPPAPNRDEHVGLGQAMAEQAIQLLGGSGKLIVISRDTSNFETPAVELQLKGFNDALRQAGRKVDTSRSIRVDPLRVVAVPPGEFFEVLRKTTEADVVVSFMGPPTFSDAQASQLKGKKARVVALCLGNTPRQVDLRRLFAGDFLHAAIISRPNVGRVLSSLRGPRAVFDHYFLVVTAANVAELNPFYETR